MTSVHVRQWHDQLEYVAHWEWSVPGCKPVRFTLSRDWIDDRDERQLREKLCMAQRDAMVIFFPNDHPVWWWRE